MNSLYREIIKKLILTAETMFGTSIILVIVTAVSPLFEYKNNQQTENRIGTKYMCAFPQYGYEKATVKIIGELQPQITSEMLEKGEVKAKIIGLKGKMYIAQDHNIAISFSADKVEVISDGK
ncbi:MAG: hypothetical protein IJ683_06955 [Butyrivibrio sp.]|nr:hypothetical protein [Butyrivibrio sp.]MBR1642042.1 hypothetical protein [Butyrivibrio sp.]